jgi:hypothetical protein
LTITVCEEAAMARAATGGVTIPDTASGTATAL